ncbi:MAG: phage tail tape measure protein [Acidobacteria bacterium 13_1_20CM_3_53_8]|nr:MAG: phage tail tape measure protein [Acidobacteria bacterium 13_1_20CM_3_53_8]
MAGEIYELAILLTLKDIASGGLDRVEHKLQATGKEGRAMLKTFQELRSDLKQGLAIGGAGLATLAMLRNGVNAAGDFEASMADLRLSIQELGTDGQINVAKMNAEMNELEHLSLRLGNALPGTTQNFVEMLSTLKQGGLSTQSILNGTGEAVANLAVITHQVPRDLAEPFAQYAQQFQLTGEEATKLADTLARLKFATGLNPQELIEGSKFFQLRAGSPLGLTGLQGAEMSGRLLGTLRRYGLEGGIGGRELADFVLKLNFKGDEQKKALQELHKMGIDLQFFNKRGEFLGFDNLFTQMQKLRGLNTQQSLSIGETLFGREALGIASAFTKAGSEGWNKINNDINKSSTAQQKLNEITSTYNAKLEAVEGTLTNIKATAFLPLLEQIKPALDFANEFASGVQDFSQAHSTIALITSDLVSLGGITLTVYGGFKVLTTGWKLWRIASAVGSHESGLINFLKRTNTEAARAGDSLGAASAKAGSLTGRLGGLARGFTIAVRVAEVIGLEYAIQKAITEYENAQEARRGAAQASQEGAAALARLREHSATAGVAIEPRMYEGQAASAFAILNLNNQLREAFAFGQSGYSGMLRDISNPYRSWGGIGGFDPERARNYFKQMAPDLQYTEVMRAFLKKLETSIPDTQQRHQVLNVLQQDFPTAFREATQQTTESLTQLREPLQQTNISFQQMPQRVDSANRSLDTFSNKLNNLQLSSPWITNTPAPAGPVNTTTTPANPFLQPHSQSRAFPSMSMPEANPRGSSSVSRAGDVRFTYSPQVTLHGSSSEELRNEFAAMLDDHSRDIERIVTRRLEEGRARAGRNG